MAPQISRCDEALAILSVAFIPHPLRVIQTSTIESSAYMTCVRLEHIEKRFGETLALSDINLRIETGELFFLLGPSGCGKSTLLRLIAGLHEPSSGRILFNDRDVTGLGTEKRNAVMCFQSYALWPHMTVADNVAFGLGVRSIAKAEREARVAEVLRLVQMEEFAGRKPNQLSGGQQQRVALARALAVKPDCLLLDEPLSNLDAKLRLEMRVEIRRICKTAGFTTIYVTHDMKEALSVADRIAVMRAGKLAQVGTSADLYHRPASGFVADFIGSTNLVKGRITRRDDQNYWIDSPIGTLKAAANGQPHEGEIVVSIRPEQIRVAQSSGQVIGANRLTGRVVETTFLGEASEHVLDISGQRLRVICAPPLFNVPPEMTVEFRPEDAVVLAE